MVGIGTRHKLRGCYGSSELIAVTLDSLEFMQLMEQEPEFAQAVRSHSHIIEVFELVNQELQRHPDTSFNAKDLARQLWQDTLVVNLLPGKINSLQFDKDHLWILSAGIIDHMSVGFRLLPREGRHWQSTTEVRILGIPWDAPQEETSELKIAPAPEYPPDPYSENLAPAQTILVSGKGPIDAPLACFQMLNQILGVLSAVI